MDLGIEGKKAIVNVGALGSLKVQHSLCVTSLRLFRLVLYATAFTAATPLSLVKKIGANDITMRLTNVHRRKATIAFYLFKSLKQSVVRREEGVCQQNYRPVRPAPRDILIRRQ